MKRLVLIDGHALIHRAYHALPPLTTSNGQPINAVYGFTTMLLKFLGDLHPDYVAATFDRKTPTFRHLEYKEYKAKRPPMPDDLKEQIPLVKRLVESFGIVSYELDGYEADDLIGTITHEALTRYNEVDEIYIVTGDRDTLQLVGPKVKVYTMKFKISDILTLDENSVRQRYGLNPDQITDFKALRGDPSDNIPGVMGIGEKTATTLLQKYNSLGNIYEHLPQIDAKTREKLNKYKDQAFLSFKLATIVCNAPIEVNLKSLEFTHINKEKTIPLFEEFGFKSLLPKLTGTTEKELKEKKEEKGKKEKNEQLTFI